MEILFMISWALSGLIIMLIALYLNGEDILVGDLTLLMGSLFLGPILLIFLALFWMSDNANKVLLKGRNKNE